MHVRRVAAALGRCACVLVCVDACDARGCVSTLRLDCRTSLCRCSARVSLAAFARRFAVAVLLGVERLFARAWCHCRHVVTCASVAVSLRCRVG
jgi:hypothetical protein